MRNDANVLVAGAGGVLGRNIVEAFYKEGLRLLAWALAVPHLTG